MEKRQNSRGTGVLLGGFFLQTRLAGIRTLRGGLGVTFVLSGLSYPGVTIPIAMGRYKQGSEPEDTSGQKPVGPEAAETISKLPISGHSSR